MPIPQTYFLDSSTLGGATSIYMDAQLTICAPDGYYSDGVITREQVSCILLPQQVCESCALPCGESIISASGGSGLYSVNINIGAGTGAILVKFTPFGVPDGIKAVFNSLVWNKLSSPIDGYHQSTNPSSYTFVGDVALDCGLAGSTYPTLVNYLYDGTTFVNQGTTTSVSVAAGDVSLSAGNPGQCVMVIPKTTSGASVLNILSVGACSSTIFNVIASCPEPLRSFESSERLDSSEFVCLEELVFTYYFASLTDIATIDIFDYVFSDENGEFPLKGGFYLIDNDGDSQWIEVENGIVIAIGNCVPSCPDRRVVFQICNSNSEIDDNFDIYLNDVYIGAVDLNSTSQVGSVFIADLDTMIGIGSPDFVCPLLGMVTYHFDPALLLPSNVLEMRNTQNNNNNNLGQIGVRNYLLSGSELIDPCVITNLTYSGDSGVNFTFTFPYTECCAPV